MNRIVTGLALGLVTLSQLVATPALADDSSKKEAYDMSIRCASYEVAFASFLLISEKKTQADKAQEGAQKWLEMAAKISDKGEAGAIADFKARSDVDAKELTALITADGGADKMAEKLGPCAQMEKSLYGKSYLDKE